MLKACVIDFKGSWSKYLLSIEFAYNNCYHTIIRMTSFDALYSKKYKLPIHWDEMSERKYLELDLMIEVVEKIRQKMNATQSKQKYYADNERRYEVWEDKQAKPLIYRTI